MAVLKAGKLEDNSDPSQKLIASLNRGGLRSLLESLPAQKIFVKLESLFRQLTPNVNLQGINLSGTTQKAITVSDILSNFDLMVAEAIIKPENHVRKDVLLSTVNLYVRVCAFSMSKDVIQRHKYTAIKTNKV